jgi:hypothetical protein
MKTTKKALLLALCAVLLVVSTVFATLAYLTTDVKVVKNTFTVGEIEITLDEADVTEYGVEVENAPRVTGNEYKLIPGHEYTKDPIVHVVEKSEPCYVFVKLDNGLKDIIIATDTIEAQMAANNWVLLSGNVYYYKNSVDARSGQVDLPVFESFELTDDAVVKDYVNKTITVKAYAVQADGFDNAAAAWTAASTTWGE